MVNANSNFWVFVTPGMIDFSIEWLPLRFSRDWIILNSCSVTKKHILYQNYGIECDLYYNKKFLEESYIYFILG